MATIVFLGDHRSPCCDYACISRQAYLSIFRCCKHVARPCRLLSVKLALPMSDENRHTRVQGAERDAIAMTWEGVWCTPCLLAPYLSTLASIKIMAVPAAQHSTQLPSQTLSTRSLITLSKMAAILDAIRHVSMGNLVIFAVMFLASLLALLAYLTMRGEKRVPGFPTASVPGLGPKLSWFFHGRRLLVEAAEKVSSLPPRRFRACRFTDWRSILQYTGPFQVMTGTGPRVVLPNRFIDEIRNHPHTSFIKAVAEVGHCRRVRVTSSLMSPRTSLSTTTDTNPFN